MRLRRLSVTSRQVLRFHYFFRGARRSRGTGAKALLLDEPAAGLGGGDIKRLAEVLVDLRKRNVALVVIEHHMDLIMSIADRIVMIDQGVLLATGTPAEIQRDPKVR